MKKRLSVCNARLRRQSIVVSIIVLIAVGFVLYRNLPTAAPSPEGSPNLPAFQWNTYLGPSDSTSGRSDWQKTIGSGRYKTFEALRYEIINNRLNPPSIKAFEEFAADKNRMQRINDLLGELDGENRDGAIAQLYSELMRCQSNTDALFEHLVALNDKAFKGVIANPRDNGRYSGWAMSFTNQSCLIAYEATSEERFLNLLTVSIERSLSYRDDRIGRIDEARGRVMHSWGGDRYTKDGRHTTNITLAGRVCFSMLQFCQIVRETPHLQDKFSEQAERFLADAQACMDEYESEFRDGTLPGEGFYYSITHDEVEAINHQAAAGNALILLHELTGREKYGRMAEQLATFFRNCMWLDENDCLIWTYKPSPDNRNGPPPERLWKARITIEFPLFAYQHGVVFTRQDMEAIARMFLTNICRSNGRFSWYLDGNFRDMEERKNEGSGLLALTSFIMYDEFDPKIRDVIEDLVADRPDIGGWLKSTHGLKAYSYRLKPQIAHEDGS